MDLTLHFLVRPTDPQYLLICFKYNALWSMMVKIIVDCWYYWYKWADQNKFLINVINRWQSASSGAALQWKVKSHTDNAQCYDNGAYYGEDIARCVCSVHCSSTGTDIHTLLRLVRCIFTISRVSDINKWRREHVKTNFKPRDQSYSIL